MRLGSLPRAPVAPRAPALVGLPVAPTHRRTALQRSTARRLRPTPVCLLARLLVYRLRASPPPPAPAHFQARWLWPRCVCVAVDPVCIGTLRPPGLRVCGLRARELLCGRRGCREGCALRPPPATPRAAGTKLHSTWRNRRCSIEREARCAIHARARPRQQATQAGTRKRPTATTTRRATERTCAPTAAAASRSAGRSPGALRRYQTRAGGALSFK